MRLAPLSIDMSQRTRSEVGDGTIDSKFYLPAGVDTSLEPRLLKRLRARLFSHSV
jgi:hypothetical protein